MDLQAMSDRELDALIREAGAELIKRAQVRRASERAQLRMEVATA